MLRYLKIILCSIGLGIIIAILIMDMIVTRKVFLYSAGWLFSASTVLIIRKRMQEL